MNKLKTSENQQFFSQSLKNLMRIYNLNLYRWQMPIFFHFLFIQLNHLSFLDFWKSFSEKILNSQLIIHILKNLKIQNQFIKLQLKLQKTSLSKTSLLESRKSSLKSVRLSNGENWKKNTKIHIQIVTQNNLIFLKSNSRGHYTHITNK